MTWATHCGETHSTEGLLSVDKALGSEHSMSSALKGAKDGQHDPSVSVGRCADG